jgi:hypothetical protein
MPSKANLRVLRKLKEQEVVQTRNFAVVSNFVANCMLRHNKVY